jgi:hypothetical protein
MKRREFVAASCLAGLAPLSALGQGAGGGGPAGRELYELRLYHLGLGPKQKLFEDFAANAAIPALNRIGIGPVGVFSSREGDTSDVWVLLPHPSAESVVTMVQKLADDEEFLKAGADFLGAPYSEPAYQRCESSLLLAFEGHPKLTVPSTSESRVFQLRTYESHSMERALKKIEMFNTGGELDIFKRVGLGMVFFGQALIGNKLPNLTYMVGFDDEDAMEAAWAGFRDDPGWAQLKEDPQYKDTVSNITNILLHPSKCSQV